MYLWQGVISVNWEDLRDVSIHFELPSKNYAYYEGSVWHLPHPKQIKLKGLIYHGTNFDCGNYEDRDGRVQSWDTVSKHGKAWELEYYVVTKDLYYSPTIWNSNNMIVHSCDLNDERGWIEEFAVHGTSKMLLFNQCDMFGSEYSKPENVPSNGENLTLVSLNCPNLHVQGIRTILSKLKTRVNKLFIQCRMGRSIKSVQRWTTELDRVFDWPKLESLHLWIDWEYDQFLTKMHTNTFDAWISQKKLKDNQRASIVYNDPKTRFAISSTNEEITSKQWTEWFENWFNCTTDSRPKQSAQMYSDWLNEFL